MRGRKGDQDAIPAYAGVIAQVIVLSVPGDRRLVWPPLREAIDGAWGVLRFWIRSELPVLRDDLGLGGGEGGEQQENVDAGKDDLPEQRHDAPLAGGFGDVAEGTLRKHIARGKAARL